MKKTIIVLFLIVPVFLVAVDNRPGLERKEGKNFIKKELKDIQGYDLILLPDFSQRDQIIEEINEYKPKQCVELLYTMERPDVKDLRLFIFNKMINLASMKGIEYWSGSRQKMYPLITELYLSHKKGSKKEMKAPRYSVVPRSKDLIFFQKDTTFGGAWYNAKIRTAADSIRISISNTSTLWYKIFPLLGSGGLKNEIVVIIEEDQLIFYGLSEVTVDKVLGKEVNLSQSFDHRLSAMQTWFADQIYGENFISIEESN